MNAFHELITCKKCKRKDVNVFLRIHDEGYTCTIFCDKCEHSVVANAETKQGAIEAGYRKWNKVNGKS